MKFRFTKQEADLLAMLDVGLGMLPISSVLKKMLERDTWSFDVKEFIKSIKATGLLQEASSGPKSNEKIQWLYNMSISERIMFGEGLRYCYYPNIVEDIFAEIKNHLKLLKRDGQKCLVEKISVPDCPAMPEDMKNNLELPNHSFDSNLENYKIIPDPGLFKKRIALTCEFAKKLEDPDKIHQFLKDPDRKLEILDKYKIRFVLPLVGTMRNQENPTVLYVITCYRSASPVSLDTALIDTDKFIPAYLEHNENMNLLLRECASMCSPAGHQANIRKLVAITDKAANHVFVVSLVTFSDKRLIPLKQTPMSFLYDHVNQMDSWKCYMNRFDIINFPLGGAKQK